jgi:hypothetical protein
MRSVGSLQFNEIRKKPLDVFLWPRNNTASIQRDATNQNMATSNFAFLVSFDKDEISFRITFEQQFFVEASKNRLIPVKLASSAIEPEFAKLEFESLLDKTHFERHISSKDAIHYKEYKKSLLMSNSKLPLDDFYGNDSPQDEPRDWCHLMLQTRFALGITTWTSDARVASWCQNMCDNAGRFRSTSLVTRDQKGSLER